MEAEFEEIEFLGHMVGGGNMRPAEKKVSKILKLATPTTKKQVRALLGLVSYYRRYVANFAAIVAPLVDLTKKNQPSKVCWSQDCQEAFDTVKEVLSSEPVVQLPDFSRQFLIRTVEGWELH